MQELRRRMPILHKREQTIETELQSLETSTMEQKTYLQFADSLGLFLSRIQTAANTANITERQKILRLLVKEVLVDKETIIIRHSIPVSHAIVPPTPSDDTKVPSYLLRSGSHIDDVSEYLSPLRDGSVV